MPASPYHARFADMPREELLDGKLARTAVRTDGGLAVFNWLLPGLPDVEPHQHPFDQLALILEGRVELDIADETYALGPGELLYIPADALHTIRVVGDEPVLNVDLFSPARDDYLHLTEHQP